MKILSAAFVFILLFSLTVKVAAAKLLPQALNRSGSGQAQRGQQTVAKATGLGINVSPRIRADRKAFIVSFSNLQNASSVSYTLVYNANGQQEGAGGTISSSGNSATRELLFGTCSKDVCRYHTNITNARFEVTYTTASGKKYLKRYRIKV